MANSYVSYSADGSTAVFAVPFGYLDQTHVTVYVNDILVDAADVAWPSPSSVNISAAHSAGSLAGKTVLIVRTTSHDARLVTWTNGTLNPDDLNEDSLQAFYMAQEALERDAITPGGAAASISVAPTGNLSSVNAQAALVELQTDIDDLRTDLEALPGRNRVIGGDFGTNPWQRGTSFVAAATGTFTADRFAYTHSSDAVCTILKTADAPTAAQAGVYTSSCLHVDVTTADGTIAAAQYSGVMYRFEGYDIADLGFGQSGTRYVTLSFWVKSTITGTYVVAFRNEPGTRSYPATYTVDSADTWEQKTITIAVDTTGTWYYDNQEGLNLYFVIACGTTFHGPADTWSAGNYFGVTGQANGVSSASNNFKLALIQLESGSVATPFERLPIATVLQQCQRYYEKSFPIATTPAQNAGVEGAVVIMQWVGAAAGAGAQSIQYKALKRTDPTVTTYNPAATNAQVRNYSTGSDASVTAVGSASNDAQFNITFTTAGGSAAGNVNAVHWTSSAEL
jgi:hypothetical protein